MENDLFYIDHIKDSINKIFEYTQNISHTEFQQASLIQDTVIRNFEIIGEATKNLSYEFTQKQNLINEIEM